MPIEKQMRYGAYHKTRVPDYDPELAETGPGTPMGEYLRKSWQPVCLSEELTDVPKAIRIMVEDLVAFRDRSGRIGVLQRHCSHRGTSLEYGIIQPKGIRCCYHGWVYDVDGTILEMPVEPKDSRIYDTSMDAPGDASNSLFGSVYAVRCCRLSGLLLRPFKCRWPVWRYADRVQIASACLKAPRTQTGFPDPVSLTVCPYLPSDLLTSPTTSRASPCQAVAGAR